MSPNAKRIASEITTCLAALGINVSNVLIGRFGIAMDAATEQDALRAADMLTGQGSKDVKVGESDGEWMVVGNLA
jgi:purine-cytosine permease-like protein